MLPGQRITLAHYGNNVGFATELPAQDIPSPGSRATQKLQGTLGKRGQALLGHLFPSALKTSPKSLLHLIGQHWDTRPLLNQSLERGSRSRPITFDPCSSRSQGEGLVIGRLQSSRPRFFSKVMGSVDFSEPVRLTNRVKVSFSIQKVSMKVGRPWSTSEGHLSPTWELSVPRYQTYPKCAQGGCRPGEERNTRW